MLIACHDPVVCEGGNIPAYLSIYRITADIVRRGFIMGGLLTIVPGSSATGRQSIWCDCPDVLKNLKLSKTKIGKKHYSINSPLCNWSCFRT